MIKGGVIMGIVNKDSQNLEAKTSVRTKRKARGSATANEIRVEREPRTNVLAVTCKR
jgi:hypothetical protein